MRATNWLGDAVMALPAVRAVRERFPEAHVAVLARGWVAELYRREACVDEVIVADGRLKLARSLRSRGFDAAILLPNSFESALVAWMAGIPNRIGYDRDRRGVLLTKAVAPPKPGEIPQHERFYYLELLRRAGLLSELPADAPVTLHAAAEACRSGAELFRAMGFEGPVVGVSPGAQNSRAKQWIPERFVSSALSVAASIGGSVALFGSRQERPLCQAMAEEVRRAGCPVLNLAGETSLLQFIELAAACRVFLTNDSGAMHVASALAVPTVAVFGPTEYFATSPAGPRSIIVREPVDCSPCMLRDCPIDHRCMTAVTAEKVAETALGLLK
ncbi:MAG: lipopolysaccharide heptosyltransferase II [Acidobacteriota bacterium]